MGDPGPLSLAQALEDPRRREAITADLVRLIDEEVQAKGGVSGAVLRAGYAAFVKLKPGIVRLAVDHLLPEFAGALDPFWAQAVRDGSDRTFTERADTIADRLLSITDARAARSSNRVLTRLYATLRPSAQRHVAQSVPRLPPVIRRHVA